MGSAMPRRARFRDRTSYGDSFHEKAASPVTEYRCKTEMSRPTGDMDLTTVTRQLPTHSYGRPVIARPVDNDIFVEQPDEGYSTAATSLSSATAIPTASEPGANNHHTGYEKMSRSVRSTLDWQDGRDMTTTNARMFPARQPARYKKVDRNDFVKYVDFGFDTPVLTSVYGGDFKSCEIKKHSPVMRKASTTSLEGSGGVMESTSTYNNQFRGEKSSPAVPTLTELDNNLRSSIELK